MKSVNNFFAEIGEQFIFLYKVLGAILKGPIEFHETLQHCYRVGVQSLPVVFMAGFFVGAIICIQFNHPLEMLGATVYLGGVTGSAILREVGPMLIAAMISARIGAFIAAELGTMKVTEQVDAVRCLGTDPIQFLVVPRFIAVVLMVLVLTILGLMIANVGAALIAYSLLNVNFYYYFASLFKLADTTAFMYALVKGFVFGLVVATVSCRKGMTADGGAVGVGEAVRSSLVVAAIGLFTANYFISVTLSTVTRLIAAGKALY